MARSDIPLCWMGDGGVRTLSKTVKIGVAICAILVAYMGYAKIRLATCTADQSDMIRLT